MGYPEIIIADAPTYYWRLSEASGNPVSSMPGASILTKSGTWTHQVEGAIISDSATNYAMSAATTTGLCYLTRNASLNWAKFSYELWFIQPSANAGSDLFLFSHGTGPQLKCRHGGSDRLTFVFSSFVLQSSTSHQLDVWNHAVVTAGSGVVKIYLNGQLVGSGPLDTAGNTSQGLAWGTGPSGTGIVYGSLDELAYYYNKSLTADQISVHYLAGRPPVPVSGSISAAWNIQLECTARASYSLAATIPARELTASHRLEAGQALPAPFAVTVGREISAPSDITVEHEIASSRALLVGQAIIATYAVGIEQVQQALSAPYSVIVEQSLVAPCSTIVGRSLTAPYSVAATRATQSLAAPYRVTVESVLAAPYSVGATVVSRDLAARYDVTIEQEVSASYRVLVERALESACSLSVGASVHARYSAADFIDRDLAGAWSIDVGSAITAGFEVPVCAE
ncbi:MAG: LamG domain-containing protein [Magnetococcales bacterium]|nr:LamG domain-containing protein [Magnetococcales bacterium]MBF0151855.1 LamG domain-containing protein [Magnetococcales bacterium]